MITIPNDENLNKINFPQLFVEIELKAVVRIKFLFFKWFEELIKSILKNNLKFMKRD